MYTYHIYIYIYTHTREQKSAVTVATATVCRSHAYYDYEPLVRGYQSTVEKVLLGKAFIRGSYILV